VKHQRGRYIELLQHHVIIDDDTQLAIFRKIFNQTICTMKSVICFIYYFDLRVVPQDEINQFLKCFAFYGRVIDNQRVIESLLDKGIDVSIYVYKVL
jgi:hypothetical protein